MRLDEIEEKVEDSIYFTEEDLLDLQEVCEDIRQESTKMKDALLKEFMNYTEIPF